MNVAGDTGTALPVIFRPSIAHRGKCMTSECWWGTTFHVPGALPRVHSPPVALGVFRGKIICLGVCAGRRPDRVTCATSPTPTSPRPDYQLRVSLTPTARDIHALGANPAEE